MLVYKYKCSQNLQNRFEQTQDIAYDEIFAPMDNMITTLLVLSLAAHFAWQVFQIGVKNTFLNGKTGDNLINKQKSRQVET